MRLYTKYTVRVGELAHARSGDKGNTANVGVISRQDAIGYGCSGPVLRGSGVNFDLRKDEPYSIYDRFDWQPAVGSGKMGTTGDCWDRYKVRMDEMEQSTRIVAQAIEAIPKRGEVMAEMPKNLKIPPSEIFFRAENPKGELGFWIVSDGGTVPFRCKTRSPSIHNLSVVEKVGRGLMISDLVATIGSLDLVLGEIDR